MNRKARNGQGGGKIISLAFNTDIPIEARAHAMSQRLGSIGHGVRKSVLIAALAALADYSEIIGRDATTEELSAMFLARLLGGTAQTHRYEGGEPPPREEVDLLIETDSRGIDAEDIAANFLDTGMW
jgi:hypothetical protein